MPRSRQRFSRRRFLHADEAIRCTVAERLPANPMVIEPLGSFGRYGDPWRA